MRWRSQQDSNLQPRSRNNWLAAEILSTRPRLRRLDADTPGVFPGIRIFCGTDLSSQGPGSGGLHIGLLKVS
jgi:hypothetical protein